MTLRITRRQMQVLLAIEHHIAKRRCPPTLREIGAYVGITTTNGVADHLHALERKGLVDRGVDFLSRQTTLTALGKAAISGTTDVDRFKPEQAVEALDL